jgi:hypothetical protein
MVDQIGKRALPTTRKTCKPDHTSLMTMFFFPLYAAYGVLMPSNINVFACVTHAASTSIVFSDSFGYFFF